ncbi:MAG TPA: zinc ribbon domain-containing protein, partial [Chloroflexota bacterium]|nr:zinc ribbon domain-containing protein [Chloroflexota bacterium]
TLGFIILILILVDLIPVIATPLIAQDKGHDPAIWFLLAVITSWLALLVVVLIADKQANAIVPYNAGQSTRLRASTLGTFKPAGSTSISTLCWQCDNPVARGAMFCPVCGAAPKTRGSAAAPTRVAEAVRSGQPDDITGGSRSLFTDCVNCSNSLTRGARFCPTCGADQNTRQVAAES